MKKSMFFSLIAIGFAASLAAQTVTLYHVPTQAPGRDYAPSICANRYGDIMLIYDNDRYGVQYYYKNHASASWVGPTRIPEIEEDLTDMQNTDLAETADGDFIALACATNNGLHYARFDRKTQQWTDQQQIFYTYGRIESGCIRQNPVTKDIVVVYMYVVFNPQPNKDIFGLVKTSGGSWGSPISLVSTPYGDALNYFEFDEHGRMVLAYKTDFFHGGVDNGDLGIAVDMKDPTQNYKTITSDLLTYDFTGWQFCPTIGILKGGKGMLVYFWFNNSAYYYIPMQIHESTIDYDWEHLKTFVLIGGNVTPHFTFYNKTMAYVDEFVCTYVTVGHAINLVRNKNDQWLLSQQVELTAGERTYSDILYGGWVQPALGILTAWTPDNQTVSFSIYDYKKSLLQQPINLTLSHKNERSLFKQVFMNLLTWENDPFNVDQSITISKYNIYRRAKNSKQDYAKIGEVAGNASKLTYLDKTGVSATNKFDYGVTAVDSTGTESSMTEVK